jgi:hypothetical protein
MASATSAEKTFMDKADYPERDAWGKSNLWLQRLGKDLMPQSPDSKQHQDPPITSPFAFIPTANR